MYMWHKYNYKLKHQVLVGWHWGGKPLHSDWHPWVWRQTHRGGEDHWKSCRGSKFSLNSSVLYFMDSILRESHPSHWYVLNWILFQTLRDQIKYINVFVIAFKQTDTRMTYALRSMISLFEKMFGDGFWNNAILEVQPQTIFLKRADI